MNKLNKVLCVDYLGKSRKILSYFLIDCERNAALISVASQHDDDSSDDWRAKDDDGYNLSLRDLEVDGLLSN